VYWIPIAVLFFFLFPVRLTVLAPGELVPTKPVIVRSPIEGVIAHFHVKPNERVEVNQPLFDFDEVLLQSRTTVAAQSLETALAQYRQTSQLALSDPKYKADLAAQAGTVQERRAEATYLADQLKRSRVLAEKAGMVLFDDASSWLGKPVAIGESIMRIVQTDDVEVEAWLPLADAVTLKEGSRVQLYLQSDPLNPVQASLRYVAHQAVERPDGIYAYRVRAALTKPTKHRVGLKGTAKLESNRTTMFYWLFRRPLTVVRTTLGI
jgi:multidrug efflux pump subunit AcrA (membrane-fusion protein)